MQDGANRSLIRIQRPRKTMRPCPRSAFATSSSSTSQWPWASDPANINHGQVVWAFMFMWIEICILNPLAHSLDRNLGELTNPCAQVGITIPVWVFYSIAVILVWTIELLLRLELLDACFIVSFLFEGIAFTVSQMFKQIFSNSIEKYSFSLFYISGFFTTIN